MKNPVTATVVGKHGLIGTAALMSLPGRPQRTLRCLGSASFRLMMSLA